MATQSPSENRPLVATEYGVGYFNEHGELVKSFGVHVSPKPRNVRPATETEASLYLASCAAIAREVSSYYDRATYTGD